jgi:hypothetical protein
MAAPAPPQLSPEDARKALDKAIEALRQPENISKLKAIIDECNALPPDQQMMAKMMKLMPEVTNTLGATMKDFGFDPATVPNAVMMGMMQIQMHGTTDPSIAADCAMVMKAVSGNFDDLLNTEEEEICD